MTYTHLWIQDFYLHWSIFMLLCCDFYLSKRCEYLLHLWKAALAVCQWDSVVLPVRTVV